MLGTNRIDAPALGALRHQDNQVFPHRVELTATQLLPGAIRRDVVAKQNFGAIDVAHSGKHSLIHQKRPDGCAAAFYSIPRRRRVGFLDRIRTDAAHGCFLGVIIK